MTYTLSDIKAELAFEIKHGNATLDQLEDRLGEYVDSALPVYNSDIIKEWQAMPGEYDGQGVAEFGSSENPTVYSLMINDLYFYLYDLYQDALRELTEDATSEDDPEEKSLWQQVFPTIAEQARKARENA